MVQNATGLWDVIVGKQKHFADLEFEEALSGLFFVGCMFSGVCHINGEEIGRFA